MSSLLEYKKFKSMPDSVKKSMVERVVNKVIERQEKETTVKPLSVEESPGDPVSTMEIDDHSIPEELRDSQKHGGPTELLVQRLRESREE